MAEPWIKVGTEILRNPKIGQVGRDGLVVFLELLASCIRNDRDGVIPARYSSPKHLAGLLFQFRFTSNRIGKTLGTLASAGLIERIPAGGWFICGWDDYWKPPYSQAERQATRRHKRRKELGLDASDEEADGGNSHGDGVTTSRAKRDESHEARHAPKEGREEGRKDRKEGAREEGSVTAVRASIDERDPWDASLGCRKSYAVAAYEEADRVAKRDSHPLGVRGFIDARIAIAWHPRIKSGDVSQADVPACFLDLLLDPETQKLLPAPLDPVHEAGRLAEIRQTNANASRRSPGPLFDPPKKETTA